MQGEQGACAVLGAVEDGCLLMRRYDTHDLFLAVSKRPEATLTRLHGLQEHLLLLLGNFENSVPSRSLTRRNVHSNITQICSIFSTDAELLSYTLE